MLTDRELQQLRNDGFNDAADEIERLRAAGNLVRLAIEHLGRVTGVGPQLNARHRVEAAILALENALKA